jgi:hypothetical protein|tara:strand:+ start:213 stop:479 length:267 start_codon:yes stop_codon:yes gene_type:complete
MVDERKCFDSLNWKWAKTYEKTAPHWYSKRLENKDYFMWEFLFQVIDYHGVEEYFGGRKYKYYYCGGFKYWITEIKRPKQFLINKAKV